MCYTNLHVCIILWRIPPPVQMELLWLRFLSRPSVEWERRISAGEEEEISLCSSMLLYLQQQMVVPPSENVPSPLM